MRSGRLIYEPVRPHHLDDFHKLIQDAYVRHYLLDGEVFPREWTAERIFESHALFETHGVGIWLVREKASAELLGFCGFMVIPSVDSEPQLIYALFEEFTGKGYATEMARAAIEHAHRYAKMTGILASVDEVNSSSLRILEKLGFKRISVQEGSFGNMFLLRLSLECGARDTGKPL